MPLSARLLLLGTACANLTACGTASHFLGQASGLVNAITSPVLGAVRLSDETPAASPVSAPADKTHESRPTPAKRRD